MPQTPGTPLVHIVDDVPELADAAPVLLHCLNGFLDAGNAAARAVEHLLAGDAGRVVASFDVDALYDYRARRPALTFVENRYEAYEAPRLVVRVLRDGLDTPYLLLHGAEPDTQWEAYAAAVRTVVEHFGVRLTVSLGAVPMAVPHTRPVMVTNHATRPGLLVAENIWSGTLRVPASALAVTELRLGEWEHDAMGFVAHIPHYIAQLDFPSASVRLLESVEVVSGLEWDLAPLGTQGEQRLAEIAGQIEDSEDVREVVAGLEQQYDSFHRPAGDEALPLAEEQELPTGDELGAEFERFLAGLDRPEE